MDNGDARGLTEENLHALVQASTAWIAHAAGVTPEVAVKAIQKSSEIAGELQEFFRIFMDPKIAATKPCFGIRLHYPGGQKYIDFVAPKKLPGLMSSAGWIVDSAGDLGAYMVTHAMLTSIEARAIMLAQGYWVEFTQMALPPKQSKIII